MSVPQKIQKLRNFIATNPALADIGFAIVGNQAITPRTALYMLERGQNTQAIIQGLAAIGVDPPEQDYLLTLAYYQNLLAIEKRTGRKAPNIYVIPQGKVTGGQYTIQQAIAHLQQKDLVGAALVQSYQGLQRETARRMARTP